MEVLDSVDDGQVKELQNSTSDSLLSMRYVLCEKSNISSDSSLYETAEDDSAGENSNITACKLDNLTVFDDDFYEELVKEVDEPSINKESDFLEEDERTKYLGESDVLAAEMSKRIEKIVIKGQRVSEAEASATVHSVVSLPDEMKESMKINKVSLKTIDSYNDDFDDANDLQCRNRKTVGTEEFFAELVSNVSLRTCIFTSPKGALLLHAIVAFLQKSMSKVEDFEKLIGKNYVFIAEHEEDCERSRIGFAICRELCEVQGLHKLISANYLWNNGKHLLSRELRYLFNHAC